MTIALVVVVVLGVLFALWAMGVYNALIRLRNAVKNAWSQIDVQLKRRHDLIPNLVETVKGYMTHERETLENVTRARNLAQNASGVADRGKAEGNLSQALSNFFVVVEQYPDLKANQNFLALQEELTSTENKVAFARQAYNDAVMAYNIGREKFPASIIAGSFGFLPAQLLELENPVERVAPKVSFT